MTGQERMSLAARALAAREQAEQERVAAQRQHLDALAAETIERVRALFGVEAQDTGRLYTNVVWIWFVRPIVATADDLCFILPADYGAAGVALLGPCPQCGMEVESDPVETLAELGELLVGFKPHRRHYYRAAGLTLEEPAARDCRQPGRG